MLANPIELALYHLTRRGWPWCIPLHWLRIFSPSRLLLDPYRSCPVCHQRYAS